MKRLASELGAELPQEFAALSEAELDRLHELLAQARAQQARALRDAIDQGLNFIPRLARGPVKMVLFG